MTIIDARRSEHPYRGRFAPSPTGPLHFGSVVAALGSFLDARAHNGTWVVRVEDIDPPRESDGAAQLIIKQLGALGLEADEQIRFQSHRLADYRETLSQLRAQGLVYPCACSRRQTRDRSYPGTCRTGLKPGQRERSLRVITNQQKIKFIDRIQGEIDENIEASYGDFVLRRGDGLVAYHLAVVMDDAWQNITDVVRGADLIDATARHIYLQKLLALPTPRYAHLPVAVDADGHKLSKQTGAVAIDTQRAADVLVAALGFLGQAPPAELARMKIQSILDWAIEHWKLSQVQRVKSLTVRR